MSGGALSKGLIIRPKFSKKCGGEEWEAGVNVAEGTVDIGVAKVGSWGDGEVVCDLVLSRA